jgi:hypothetical protein
MKLALSKMDHKNPCLKKAQLKKKNVDHKSIFTTFTYICTLKKGVYPMIEEKNVNKSTWLDRLPAE